jgi:hypothetical protein
MAQPQKRRQPKLRFAWQSLTVLVERDPNIDLSCRGDSRLELMHLLPKPAFSHKIKYRRVR